MRQYILTSSASRVTHSWVKQLDRQPQELSLVFIDTASELEIGNKKWLSDDRQALVDAGFQVVDYTLTGKTQNQLEKDLAPFDVFFVSGGNTFYLLQQARQSGFIDLISNPENEKIYVGSSAGSLLTCPTIEHVSQMDDPAAAPKLKSPTAAGIVPYMLMVHWGSPAFRDGYQQAVLSLYDLPYPAVILRDSQYLVVQDGQTQFFSP